MNLSRSDLFAQVYTFDTTTGLFIIGFLVLIGLAFATSIGVVIWLLIKLARTNPRLVWIPVLLLILLGYSIVAFFIQNRGINF